MDEQRERFDFTPSSFFAAPPPMVSERIQRQPECRLLWAILENAVDAYMKYATATNRRGKRLFREAEDWIRRDDPTWLCSFVSICHVVGVEPEYVRRGLRKWREDHVAPAFEQAA